MFEWPGSRNTSRSLTAARLPEHQGPVGRGRAVLGLVCQAEQLFGPLPESDGFQTKRNTPRGLRHQARTNIVIVVALISRSGEDDDPHLSQLSTDRLYLSITIGTLADTCLRGATLFDESQWRAVPWDDSARYQHYFAVGAFLSCGSCLCPVLPNFSSDGTLLTGAREPRLGKSQGPIQSSDSELSG